MRNTHRAGTTNALGTSPIKLCPSEPAVLACLSFTSPSRTAHDMFRSSLPFIPMNFSKRYTLPSHALVLNLPPKRPNPLRTSTLITRNHPSPPPSRKMTSSSLLPPGLETLQNQLTHHPTSPWGLPIYRTTHSPLSQTAWPTFLSLLQTNVRSTLREIYHLPFLARSHSQPIFSDSEKYVGLDTHALRSHFDKWVSSEQAVPEGSSRWDRWIGGRMLMPVVKRGWVPAEEEGGDGKKEEGMLWEDGKTGEQGEGVGWMYIYVGEYVGMCDVLGQGEEGWYSVYVRSPLMRDTDPSGEGEVGRLPGWWRRRTRMEG
ncbi:hypothetical protein QC762_503785 [Podospora pseudocomata]|uniref:Uncharacterized protein n=1 Tax=Podospora pseudocomata TaxID=2093779 RepID=A0ABR0GB18_9PEZI|nr:hypothetical protein QC762_503785 [Podospora pseudocomata]